MATSFSSSKDRLLEAVLGFLWRQWSSLGVAGQAASDDDRVIDPEALLLVTTRFARADPRLFDEVLDWLCREGGTLNLQRLKNLRNLYALGHPGVLAAIASTVGSRPAHLKWRVFEKELIARSAGTPTGRKPSRETGVAYSVPAVPEPLFPGVPVVGSPDERFQRFGLLRDPVHLRGLSQMPDPHRPTNLLFKLRALFGLQARAEIMACLLGSEAAHPAQIAELAGYYPRTAQLALNEMARSGHLIASRTGREKHFHLRREEWRFLLKSPGGGFPRWINWGPLFALLEAVTEKIGVFRSEPVANEVQAIELRRAFDDSIPALTRSGLRAWFQTSPDLVGKDLVDTLIDDLTLLLAPTGNKSDLQTG